MSKKGNYEKILKLIAKEPLSQKEIRLKLGMGISIQGISKHLKRLLEKREICFLGNKVRKLDTKIFLKGYYGKKWTEDSHQMYFSTPESGKLYNKLIRKFKKKNKKLIDDITFEYRVLEIISKFQDLYAPKGTKLRADINKIYEKRNEIIKIDSSSEEFKKFIKIIRMNSSMFVVAYKEKKIRNEITIPMFNKLKDLFIKINI